MSDELACERKRPALKPQPINLLRWILTPLQKSLLHIMRDPRHSENETVKFSIIRSSGKLANILLSNHFSGKRLSLRPRYRDTQFHAAIIPSISPNDMCGSFSEKFLGKVVAFCREHRDAEGAPSPSMSSSRVPANNYPQPGPKRRFDSGAAQ